MPVVEIVYWDLEESEMKFKEFRFYGDFGKWIADNHDSIEVKEITQFEY